MKNCPICTYHYHESKSHCPTCGADSYFGNSHCVIRHDEIHPFAYRSAYAAHGCIRQEQRQFGQTIRIEMCDAEG